MNLIAHAIRTFAEVNKTAEDALHVNLILAENGDGGYMDAIRYYMEMIEREEMFNSF